MIEKIHSYITEETSFDGTVGRYVYHPTNEDLMDKINEIIDYLNLQDISFNVVVDKIDALRGRR